MKTYRARVLVLPLNEWTGFVVFTMC